MTAVTTWSRQDLADHRDALLDVYAAAMGVDRRVARARRSIVTGHLDRRGLAAVAAHDGDLLVGVAYGYVGERGQWWHDQVDAAMTRETAQRWLHGAFEVCELHVLPSHQGTGTGRALLDALLSGRSGTAVLTTPDAETRARAFYRAGGWVDLVRDLRFPGDPRSFAVLGLALG
ncbi:MAG: GNAT family N-acetyltransferase [Mycobacteriales bacterium]|nr:GNAT family N-acetyltransferase [Mycobacteriales bacterium]